jgi:hypothetical protein
MLRETLQDENSAEHRQREERHEDHEAKQMTQTKLGHDAGMLREIREAAPCSASEMKYF